MSFPELKNQNTIRKDGKPKARDKAYERHVKKIRDQNKDLLDYPIKPCKE